MAMANTPGSLVLWICSWLLIFSAPASAQQMPLLSAGELPGWQLTETRHFSDSQLYGYIDGGAEIFREYGFKNLSVQEFSSGDRELIAEIYRMQDSLAAFGVFSVYRRQCESKPLPGKYHCFTPYQLLLARGPFYISIINFQGDSLSQAASIQIAQAALSKIADLDFFPPPVFHRKVPGLNPEHLKWVKGRLGLQNGYPDWVDRFAGYANYSLYILPFTVRNSRLILGRIEFSGAADLQRFREQNNIQEAADGWSRSTSGERQSAVRQADSNALIILEAPVDFTGIDKLLQYF